MPIILNYIQNGAVLNGNIFQLEKSYILNDKDLLIHFTNNIILYINIFKNPIFWFFISGYLTQKTIKWVTSGK